MKDSSDHSAGKGKVLRNRKIVGMWLFFLFIGMFALLSTRLLVIAVGKNVKNVNLNDQAQKLYTQTQTLKAAGGLFMMRTETPSQKIQVHIHSMPCWIRGNAV